MFRLRLNHSRNGKISKKLYQSFTIVYKHFTGSAVFISIYYFFDIHGFERNREAFHLAGNFMVAIDKTNRL